MESALTTDSYSIAVKIGEELLQEVRSSVREYRALEASIKASRDAISGMLANLGVAHRWVDTRLDLKGPDGNWVIGTDLRGLTGSKGTKGDNGEATSFRVEGNALQYQNPDTVGWETAFDFTSMLESFQDDVDAAVAAGVQTVNDAAADAVEQAIADNGLADLPDDLAALEAEVAGKESTANKGVAGGYAPLGLDNKVPTAHLPSLAITDTFVTGSQLEMLNLSAEKGDIAVRTDINKSFVLSTNSPSTLADWIELRTPTDTVLSVAGLTGAISAPNLRTALAMSVADVSGLQTALDSKLDLIHLSVARANIPSRTIPVNSFVVAGFSTIGDGGQGALYKVGTSSGLLAIQDAAGTWFEYVPTVAINVKHFGAKGDGVTDDTAACQAALAAAKTNVAKVRDLYVPYGDYIVYATSGTEIFLVDARVRIYGDGKFSSRFVFKSGSGASIDMFRIRPITPVTNSGWHWHSFGISAQVAGTGRHGIHIDLTDNAGAQTFLYQSLFDQISVTGLGGYQFYQNKTSTSEGGVGNDGFFTSRVSGCFFSSSGLGCVWMWNSGDSLTFTDCTFTGNGIGVFSKVISGAANQIFEKNNNTAKGGQFFIWGGLKILMLYNQCEQSFDYADAPDVPSGGGIKPEAMVYLHGVGSWQAVGNNFNGYWRVSCIRMAGGTNYGDCHSNTMTATSGYDHNSDGDYTDPAVDLNADGDTLDANEKMAEYPPRYHFVIDSDCGVMNTFGKNFYAVSTHINAAGTGLLTYTTNHSADPRVLDLSTGGKFFKDSVIAPYSMGIGNESKTIPAGPTLVYTTATLTAPRAWLLPSAALVPRGFTIRIADFARGVTRTNNIQVAPAGVETINGVVAAYFLDHPGVIAEFVSNGSNGWTCRNIESVFRLFGDVNLTLDHTNRVVGTGAILTAPRTITLPSAAAFPAGVPLVIADYVAGISATNTLTIQRAGADNINGGSSVVLTVPRSFRIFRSNGVSTWFTDDVGAFASLTVAGAAVFGGTITLDVADIPNHVDDAAAAAAGVAVGRVYRNGSVLMIRVA